MSNKRAHGQYFTRVSPLSLKPVFDWLSSIPSGTAIEPFAGENSLVLFMKQLGFNRTWECYDIEPADINLTPEFPVIKQDTISQFPDTNAILCVTNPPYLAKNSAKRRNISTPNFGEYTDLYQVSLEQCLKHVPYVAAIIPESFITSSFSKTRCSHIISLPSKTFDDTDHPVCIALFEPEETTTKIYIGEHYVNDLDTIRNTADTLYSGNNLEKIRFNNPKGEWGAYLVDSTHGASIQVVKGDSIPEETVKSTSRTQTRFNIKNHPYTQDKANRINREIANYRKVTNDVLLTSFKGIRKDGKYRRRLDFSTLSKLINTSIN